jgi:glyoxylate/hydroxypyruvate reductase
LQYDGNGSIPQELLTKWCEDADALFCLLRDRIDKDFLAQCPKLRVIGSMAVGYEHIDIEECKKRLG